MKKALPPQSTPPADLCGAQARGCPADCHADDDSACSISGDGAGSGLADMYWQQRRKVRARRVDTQAAKRRRVVADSAEPA